jgi:hypothetical protein
MLKYNYMISSNKHTKQSKNKRVFRTLFPMIAAIVFVVSILEVTNTTHIFHKPQKVIVIIKSTTPGVALKTDTVNSNPYGSSSKTNQDISTQSSQAPTGSLLAPWGSFVSNHNPGSGASTSQETSVCNTTPGASCYIKLTNGSLVKILETKIADNNGSIIWNWNTDTTLDKGVWNISAVADLNGQSKTTQDSMELKVQ